MISRRAAGKNDRHGIRSAKNRTADAFNPGFTISSIFGKVSVRSLTDVLKN